jgi:uncharacterized protein
MIFCFLFDSIISNFKTSKVKHFNIIPKTVLVEDNQIDTNLKKNSTILITGGGGLIGRYLTSALLSEGYIVFHLSRSASQQGNVRAFKWDPSKGKIDPNALEGVDYIIHLAGANIGEKRWTGKRKEEIVLSRVQATRLLQKTVEEHKIKLEGFISASAIGYYGSVTSEKIFIEDDPPATDFLGTTCKQWEEVADLFGNAGVRTVKIRTAVVLEKNDSALTKLMAPARFGFLLQTGTGRQYMPWIHIKDLCNIYLKAIKDQDMSGPYNAVSPQHITQKEFIETLASVMKKGIFPIPVPSFVLKTVLGEMSDVVLKGSRISSDKIVNSGYRFNFENLENALRNVIYG